MATTTISNAAEPLAKKSLAAHSAVGLVISAVLYIIVLSGTVSVLKSDIYLIEQSGEPVVEHLGPAAAQKAAEKAMELDPESLHLYIHMPVDGNPRAIVETDNKEVYYTEDGEMSVPTHVPWSDFLIDLHYYLNLPTSFGMKIVAIFGVFLFCMSITGLFAHPNIFKDAFAFRRSRSKQLLQVDLHNRLSVWTAPFHISNSLTGAMIGLAAFSALAVGELKYDGDYEAVFEPVFGSEPPADHTKAPVANIAAALTYMAENHPEKPPVYVILHDPASAGQYLQIMAEHPDRLIYAEKYNFTMNGEFIDTVGSADGTLGQQVADSVYKVHFGNFGGMPVKLAFVIFGTCLLVIITAGMNIYFLKQKTKGRDLSGFERAWRVIQWGAPALLLATFLLALLPVELPFAAVFWGGLGVMILLSVFRRPKRTAMQGQEVS